MKTTTSAGVRGLLVGAVLLGALGTLATRSSTPVAEAASTCTQIVGFSQTMQWYFGGFQNAVGDPRNWELRWVGGGSIGNWADPSYEGWTNDSYQVDGCDQNSSKPDRGVINVSGDYNSDPAYWRQQTQLAMNNMRARYPSIQQFVLQPVVGGPNGGQCTFNGNVVRASYNFPYINQAIQQLVGGSVSAGATPTVSSCSDFADDIGHLTDQAKGPVGLAIGSFYASGNKASTPVPTATPVASPSPTPTSAAGTSAQSQTVTFDDQTRPNRPLSGQYPTGLIDWGTNNWYLSGPFGAFHTNSIGFNGAGPTSATFTFVSPRRVVQVDAYNGGTGASDVILSCNGTRATELSVPTHQTRTIPMGWIGMCNTVTMTSSNGWQTNFDNLVIDKG